MNDWTPGSVLALIIGVLFALQLFGVFELVESLTEKRRRD